MFIKKRAQSLVEYTVLLAAIIGVIMLVLFKNEGIKDKTESAYNRMGEAIEEVTNNLTADVLGIQ